MHMIHILIQIEWYFIHNRILQAALPTSFPSITTILHEFSMVVRTFMEELVGSLFDAKDSETALEELKGRN